MRLAGSRMSLWYQRMAGSAITINSNTAALSTQRQIDASSRKLDLSFQRLSSGLRINRASDDAAGLAVSSLLTADAAVYKQAQANAADASSMLSIGDGALSELSNITIRIKELAEQAANSTLTAKQRKPLHDEANALVDEYNRIVASAEFNNIKLLDGTAGTLTAQLGYGQASGVSVATSGRIVSTLGNGQWNASPTTLTGPGVQTGIATGDLNGDGFADIVASDYSSSGIWTWISNGDGTFKASLSSPTAPQGTNVMLTDLNRDGFLDAAITHAYGDLSVKLGRGDGTFGADVTYGLNGGGEPDELATGDFNGDGIPDLVIGQGVGGGAQNVNVVLGRGDGTFKSAVAVGGLTTRPRYVAVGDINNDGSEDLLVGRESGTSLLFAVLGNGDGTFKSATTINVPSLCQGLAMGDLNRDGNLDFVATLFSSTVVALGNGDGTFGTQNSLGSGGGPAKLIDYNGDGFLDIAGIISPNLKVFAGNGDGTFSALISSTGSGGSFAFGDFNGDGAIDVGIGNGIPAVTVYMPTTTRTTANIAKVYLLNRSSALATLDDVNKVIKRVNLERGANGAYSSRLSYGSSVLSTAQESYLSAASQIRDADVAEETANLVRSQILQQAGMAVLWQANQVPQIALKLLGGVNEN